MKTIAAAFILFVPSLTVSAPSTGQSPGPSAERDALSTAGQTGAPPMPAPVTSPSGSSPRQFWFDYSGQPPGKRTWQKVDDQTWTESLGNEIINRFAVIGPKVLGEVPGTLVAKITGDSPKGTGRHGNFQVFIPDLGSNSTQLWFHIKINDQWGEWKKLGGMQGATASLDPASPPDPNRFVSAATGFSLTKPASWHMATVTQIDSHQDGIRFLDRDPEDPQRGPGGVFLVVLLKHPLPFVGLNPSIHVRVRPLGAWQGKSPVEILDHLMPALQQTMADFSYIDRVEPTHLGGLPAARMQAAFRSTSAQGGEFPTLATLWVIPRGDFMFLVSTSGPPNGPDVSEVDFKAIMDSIQIEK